MVRLRYDVEVGISSSTAEQKDLGNPKYEVYTDDFDESSSARVVLAAAASDVAIPLGVISDGAFLMVRTAVKNPSQLAGNVTAKLNGTGTDAITIAPYNSKEGLFMLTTTGLTSLHLSNPGSVEMIATVYCVGD